MRTHFKSHKKKPWDGEEIQYFPKLEIRTCTGKQTSWKFRRVKKRIETVMTVCTFITLPTDVTNIFNKQNGKIMDVLYDNISKIMI